MPHEFVCNNYVITDMNVIANEFNRYFISIGHSLSEKIQSVHSSEEYLGQKANSVFKFTEVNEDCIDKIIKKLKSKSSTGYDYISNKLFVAATYSVCNYCYSTLQLYFENVLSFTTLNRGAT